MSTIYEHFRDFVKCISRFFCNFSMKIIFYLPVNTDKPKFVVFFLVFVCTNASFNAQISSSKNASKRCAIYRLRNSQALFRITDVIRNACKLVFTDLVKTKRCQHKIPLKPTVITSRSDFRSVVALFHTFTLE